MKNEAGDSGLQKSDRTNDPTIDRRLKVFFRKKTSWMSLGFLLSLIFFSLTAELWSNNKPLVFYHVDRIYFPVFQFYHPQQFGQPDTQLTDYKALSTEMDWAVWPVNSWDPFESNSSVSSYPSPPTGENWLGTDDRGRDVFARLLYGFRYSLIYAVGVWLLSYLLGTALGAVLGYFGGKVDLFGSRLVEILENMPALLFLITLIAIFSPNVWLLIFFTVLFGWSEIFHQMRAQFLMFRNREFVESARALGLSHIQVMMKHILPNALTPLVTLSPFAIASGISNLAFLDFLGLGLQAPTPSWGELMSQAQKYVGLAEWLVWSPGIMMVLTMISLITLGQNLRDAYSGSSK